MIAPRISGFGKRLKLPHRTPGTSTTRVSIRQQSVTARSVPEPDPGPCPPDCSTDTDPGAAGLTYFDDNLP